MFKSKSEIKDGFSAMDCKPRRQGTQDLGVATLPKLYFHYIEQSFSIVQQIHL